MPKVYVTKTFSFEAAHFLPNYEGACSNLHGHSYKMSVCVSGCVDDELLVSTSPATDAMVMDFKDLKKIVNDAVISLCDHAYLNKLFLIPTAEVMVIYFYHSLYNILPLDVHLESVKLWETESSFAEFRGEE